MVAKGAIGDLGQGTQTSYSGGNVREGVVSVREVREEGVWLESRSPTMAQVLELMREVAASDTTVLVTGETGTGKEVLARQLHQLSHRARGPFIAVNCGALPSQLIESELFGHERGAFTGADRRVPGKVELAHGGTLFLDEIGDLPIESQGKLLRFLQEGAFERVGGRVTLTTDARIVAATHRDLERLVAEGRFRQDLYYRLRVVEITLPPLRERGASEIVELARHFADVFARTYARPAPVFSDELVEWLSRHAFPGNVRELEHVVESAVALSPDGVLGPPDSPRTDRASTPARDSAATPAIEGVVVPLGLTLDEAARRYAEATVSAASGNKTEAARRLAISRNTLARTLGRSISQHGAEDDVPSAPSSLARDRGPDGKA
jgi:Nif-specific regulatory protein